MNLSDVLINLKPQIKDCNFILFTAKEKLEIFLTNDKKLAIQTGQNCLIILKLQLEGKKPMNSRDFLNGYPNLIGAILS